MCIHMYVLMALCVECVSSKMRYGVRCYMHVNACVIFVFLESEWQLPNVLTQRRNVAHDHERVQMHMRVCIKHDYILYMLSCMSVCVSHVLKTGICKQIS
jgi:hypothetical protein